MDWTFQCFAVKTPAYHAEWAPYGLKTFISACEAKGGFGQIIDADYLASPQHVALSVANVLESQKENNLQSRSASIELLLRLSGKRQFNEAVKMGVTSKTRLVGVIVVVPNSSGALISKWAKDQPLKKYLLNWKSHLEKNEQLLVDFFKLDLVAWPRLKKERLDQLQKLISEKVTLALL